MSSLESLNDSYREFWEKREEIKARHRIELEAELEPQRRALQRDIFKVQADYGYTVAQVAEVIGNTRAFVYLIRNDKPLIQPSSSTRRVKRVKTTPQPGLAQRKQAAVEAIASELSEDSTAGWRYEIDREQHTVVVTSPTSLVFYTYETDELGSITRMPEAWYSLDNDKFVQDFFRKIIQDIESEAVQAPPITLE